LELVGGRIWINSVEGMGSTFNFQIPCKLAKIGQRADSDVDLSTVPTLRVLVVDDNSTNRLILSEMLTARRMHATAVSLGNEVVGVLQRAHDSGTMINLVLLDVHMPQIDGFAVARMISELEFASETKVVLLSSSNAVHHAAALQQILISAYLTKPVKQSELLETILGLYEPDNNAGACRAADVASAEWSEPTPALPTRRVLVAEDNYVNQQLMLRVLSKNGYDVLLAGDGKEAVHLLKTEQVDAPQPELESPPSFASPQTPILDTSELLERIGGDNQLVEILTEAFREDGPRHIAAYTSAIRSGDLSAVKKSLIPSRDARATSPE